MKYEECVEHAVAYIKNTKNPNIAIDSSKVNQGLIGLKMWDESDKEDSIYFSFADIISIKPVIDRLALVNLFDAAPDSLVMKSPNSNDMFIFQVDNGSVYVMPKMISDLSKTVSILIQKLSDKNNKEFFDRLFTDIANKAYDQSTPYPTHEEPAKETKLYDIETPKDWTMLTVKDRIDFIRIFDVLGNNKVLSATLENFGDSVLIVESEKTLIHVVGSPSNLLPSSLALGSYSTGQEFNYIVKNAGFSRSI